MGRKDVGCGLIALVAAAAGILTGIAGNASWYRFGVAGLFLLGSLDCFFVSGKPWSGFGWLLNGVAFLLGFYVFGRWGMLIGLVVANLIVTPLINKYEMKLF